tara:strand:- start:264 stop:1265 length:1002 start_codon:yes stop_codon:yes gene_type:complete
MAPDPPSEDDWEYEDEYDNAFLNVSHERTKPQDTLPTDLDALRVWRVQNQLEARRRRELQAKHTRRAEKEREALERVCEAARVDSFQRRFFCWNRMFDLRMLREFCIHWSEREFLLPNRLDRAQAMDGCKLHLGRHPREARPLAPRDWVDSRKPKTVFPAGNPWAHNTQALYKPLTTALETNIGYQMERFHHNKPSIVAQQMRVAYMTKLWLNSSKHHAYLLREPITFEDDPDMCEFRKEARDLLRVLRLLQKQFNVNEPALMTQILEWLYLAPLPDETADDRVDPTFLHRLLTEELSAHPRCLLKTPRALLSRAKRAEFDSLFTSACSRSSS